MIMMMMMLLLMMMMMMKQAVSRQCNTQSESEEGGLNRFEINNATLSSQQSVSHSDENDYDRRDKELLMIMIKDALITRVIESH